MGRAVHVGGGLLEGGQQFEVGGGCGIDHLLDQIKITEHLGFEAGQEAEGVQVLGGFGQALLGVEVPTGPGDGDEGGGEGWAEPGGAPGAEAMEEGEGGSGWVGVGGSTDLLHDLAGELRADLGRGEASQMAGHGGFGEPLGAGLGVLIQPEGEEMFLGRGEFPAKQQVGQVRSGVVIHRTFLLKPGFGKSFRGWGRGGWRGGGRGRGRGVPGAGAEVGFEPEFEGFAGTEDEGFGGGHGDPEHGGDVLIGEFGVTKEEDGGALVFGETLEGFGDFGFQLAEEDGIGDPGWIAFGGQEIGGGIARVGGSVEGFGGVAAAAAEFVQAEVAGDGEEPGGEAGGDAVTGGGFPGLEEDLLGDVFGIPGIMEGSKDEVTHGLAVFIDQAFEGLEIPLLGAEHAGGIFVVAGGHSRDRLVQSGP